MTLIDIHETFADAALTHWSRQVVGGGELQVEKGVLRLGTHNTVANAYSNAQLYAYGGRSRRSLPWRPPLRMEVRARFSHATNALRGTAGFGFWNDPFVTTGRLPTLPRAVWFFYASPPSDMKLDLLAPGSGWKAATIDAWRLPFLLLAPTAPLACPLMRIPLLYRSLWPLGQMALGVREATIAVDMRVWHTYTLHWESHNVRFLIDGTVLLESPFAPQGPLGFVAWLDNQYAIVTPQGAFGGGLLDAPGDQWLEIANITIKPE